MRLRIWILHPKTAEPVKLALEPGVTLTHAWGGKTDEGWHWGSTEWVWCPEDGTVTESTYNRGRDCDGGYSDGGQSYCIVSTPRLPCPDGARRPIPVADLQDLEVTGVTMARFRVMPRGGWQRDHSAEQAGY